MQGITHKLRELEESGGTDLVPQSDAGYCPTSDFGGDALTRLYSNGQVSCTILGLLLFHTLLSVQSGSSYWFRTWLVPHLGAERV